MWRTVSLLPFQKKNRVRLHNLLNGLSQILFLNISRTTLQLIYFIFHEDLLVKFLGCILVQGFAYGQK